MTKFKTKKPTYEYLRQKWIAKHRKVQDNLWEKHGESFKKAALGGLGGLLLLTSGGNQLHVGGNLIASKADVANNIDQNILLAENLNKIVPKEMRPLDVDEEKEALEILSDNFGFPVKSEIDGIRLNRYYGLIGGEQHLYRYPGDMLHSHADNTTDWAMFGSSGIAPGLGAWGYFAQSKLEFTQTDKEREKYYLAIQTFLAPGFSENVARYRDFFKYRKMLVVNAKTGQAVVAVIGDAGPAEFTGKHLGGSPEVMHYLGLANGPRKGPVLYFFIDDPSDTIPLGPVKLRRNA